MESILQDNGYETISANDGAAGLEKAKSGKPDLIVLDVSMPQKSGMGFFKELNADPELARIPVVFVTGVSGLGSDKEGLKRFLSTRSNIPEPAGFFSKPLEQDKFLKKVAEILAG